MRYTLKLSTVTIQTELNIELTEIDKKEVENISTNITFAFHGTSVDLKSFIPQLFIPTMMRT